MAHTNAYNPCHDEAFCDDVVNYLRDHKGEWCHPGRFVLQTRMGDCDAVTLAEFTYRAVTVARRLGDVIDGDTQLGYRYRCWRRVRFTDLAWASQWPDVPPMNLRSHKRRPPLPSTP